jgi:hypothetical protein
MEYNKEQILGFYENEKNKTYVAQEYCNKNNIVYTDSVRRQISKIINSSGLSEDKDLENVTETNQYKPELSNMPSAWSAEKKRFYTIEEYCDTYGLDKNSVKSSKLVSHNASHMVYNIAFFSEDEEAVLEVDTHLEEVIQKFIKPIILENKNSFLDNNDWFDRLVYTDVHVAMDVNGKSGDSLYEGKWDREEVLRRLGLMINHVLKYQKSKVLVIDDLGDFMDGLNKQTTRGGHELPQNMNDKEAFDLALLFKTSLVDSLIPHYDKIICNNITNDNHCFTPDVEVLTNEGFKFYKDVTEDHLIATYNQEKDLIEYQKPINYMYNEVSSDIEIHNYKSKLMDLSVTDEHRMFVNRHSNYDYVLSKNIIKAGMKFKCAGLLNNKEVDIDDNMIELLAWIATDGTIREESNAYFIYQSKPEGLEYIKKVLDSLNCGYKLRPKISNKEVTHICGKELKKKPLQMYEFVLNGTHTNKDFLNTLRELMPIKDIPKIIFKASKRQADLFIKTYVLGDGSVKEGLVNSATIYGTKNMLDKLQILCISNGHRATLSVNNRGDNVLCLVYDRDFISFNYKNIEKVTTKPEFTWCLTLPNSNLFVRKGGKVSVQGNSGNYSYFVSTAVEHILKCRYSERVVVNTIKKFMHHYIMGRHTFILSHGKDICEMKFSYKPRLDAIQANRIDQYCKEHNLYTGGFIEFSKGDSHQAIYDETTSNDFSYYTHPAFSPPSNWVSTNFTKSRSGFNFYNIDLQENIKVAIPYWF